MNNTILAYAILNRELERLDVKSATEGLAGQDLKTLEVIVKTFKILEEKPLTTQEPPKQAISFNNKELRKLLSNDEDES